MKKLIASSVLAAMALSMSGVALADDDRNEREDRKDKTEVRAKEEKKVEKLADRNVRRMKEVSKFWKKMKHRLSILIRNQEKLAVRIENKLKKMESQGKDVTAQKAKLVEAKKLIDVAKAALAKADTDVASALTGTDPKVAFEKVKKATDDVLKAIKAAHRALVDVISAKPSPSPSVTVTASPSPTPTPTATPTASPSPTL